MNHNFIDPEVLEADYYEKKKEYVIIKLDDEKVKELEHQFTELSKELHTKIDIIDHIKELMSVDADDEEQLRESIYDFISVNDMPVKGIKTLKKELSVIMTDLKKGFQEVLMVVYLMEDRTNKKMLTYLETGEFYSERDIADSEKQLKIKNIA
jgi:hypothetical protein